MFGAERAGTALNLGGTESGLSFGYTAKNIPIRGCFYQMLSQTQRSTPELQ